MKIRTDILLIPRRISWLQSCLLDLEPHRICRVILVTCRIDARGHVSHERADVVGPLCI